MKHQWNQAIAAYDRELPLLLALHDEYIAYIRERYDAARQAAAADMVGKAAIVVDEESVHDTQMEIVQVGDESWLPFQCQVFAASESGGTPGQLFWVLLMNKDVPASFGDPRKALAVARQESNAVATKPVDQAPHSVVSFAGFDCVRWGQIDLDDEQLMSKLTKLFVAVAVAMGEAWRAMCAIRRGNPRGWLEEVLRSRETLEGLESAGAEDVADKPWPGVGHHVVARVPGSDWCYFVAGHDGRLCFCWDKGTDPATRHQRAEAALSPCVPVSIKAYRGVVLASQVEIACWHAAQDGQAVRRVVVDVWRKYRAIHTGPLPAS